MIARVNCEHCGNGIEFEAERAQPGQTVLCPHCEGRTTLIKPNAPPPTPAPGPVCQHCRTQMQRGTQVERSLGLQLFGALVFLFIALPLTFLFPIGTLIGIPLMIACARLGYTKHQGWRCTGCGYFFKI